MQIAIKHGESPISHLYLDLSLMTFGFVHGNSIHLAAEKHPLLIRQDISRQDIWDFCCILNGTKNQNHLSRALSTSSGVKREPT